MGIDVNKLLAETKILLAIGDEEWAKDGITSGITESLAREWIQQHTFFLVNKYKFQFLQRLYATTDTTPVTIALTNSGTDIRLQDNVISVESGVIGSTTTSSTLLEIAPLRDLQTYNYLDTTSKVYAYWTLDHNDGTRILRFNSSQTSSGTITLVVLVYPDSITSFPADFYLWFKYMLILEGLLHKQSNNLGDVMERYTQLATQMETTLAKRHAASSHANFKVVTPHQYANNTSLKMGRAR